MQMIIVLGLLRKIGTLENDAFLGRDQLLIMDQSEAITDRLHVAMKKPDKANTCDSESYHSRNRFIVPLLPLGLISFCSN